MRSGPKIGEPNLPRIEFDERLAPRLLRSVHGRSLFSPRRSPAYLIPASSCSLSLSLFLLVFAGGYKTSYSYARIPCNTEGNAGPEAYLRNRVLIARHEMRGFPSESSERSEMNACTVLRFLHFSTVPAAWNNGD